MAIRSIIATIIVIAARRRAGRSDRSAEEARGGALPPAATFEKTPETS
jgi:hypothetical protein